MLRVELVKQDPGAAGLATSFTRILSSLSTAQFVVLLVDEDVWLRKVELSRLARLMANVPEIDTAQFYTGTTSNSNLLCTLSGS
jgi:hypothetical protein